MEERIRDVREKKNQIASENKSIRTKNQKMEEEVRLTQEEVRVTQIEQAREKLEGLQSIGRTKEAYCEEIEESQRELRKECDAIDGSALEKKAEEKEEQIDREGKELEAKQQ